jgi:hypothetical protein
MENKELTKQQEKPKRQPQVSMPIQELAARNVKKANWWPLVGWNDLRAIIPWKISGLNSSPFEIYLV